MKLRIACCLYLGLCVAMLGCGGGSGSNGSGSNSGGDNSGGTPTTPTVTSISPTSIGAGATATTLTVNGTGFIASTSVQVGSVTEPTTYVSSTQVTAVIPASQLASGTQFTVVAVNGTLSSASTTNLQVTNPAPAIASIAPTAAPAGVASALVAVLGTGFVPTTTMQVNGNARTTTYVSATQVNVTLTAADLATGGTFPLTAVNSAPGGGTSTAVNFAVNNPTPLLNVISPTYAVSTSASATVTLNGANFVPGSTVKVNNTAVATTYVNSTQLTFSGTGLSAPQIANVQVTNPSPGGGTSPSKSLWVLAPTPTPVITQVSPTQFYAGYSATSITVTGTDLLEQVATNSTFLVGSVLWNGTPLTTNFSNGPINQSITAQVPANLIASLGTATITVSSITSTPAQSNAITVNILPPPAPTLTSIYPTSGPLNAAANIQLTGTGFTSASTVALNGATIASKYVNSTQMTVTLPASSLTLPANYNLTVTTPAPGGGTSAPVPYTTYLSIPNNDIVYSPNDGLIYASIPGGTPNIGNSVVGIDPTTGSIMAQIYVGSNPNKLALSTNGTQLFVGLDGAAAVVQINLSSGQLVNQFSLGTGSGYYTQPNTALYMAAVPGLPNSVAVATNGSGVVIYDSGVPRTKSSYSYGYASGSISFGSSSAQLYMVANGIASFTVDSTGIAAGSIIPGTTTAIYNVNGIQYDNGSLYLTNGMVLNAVTGALQGTLYATSSNPVSGPIVSDSTLGLAFVGEYSYLTTPGTSVMAFNESTFNPTGQIPFSGSNYSGNFTLKKIIRWGQNGVALNTTSQIFIFKSPVVKDLSSSPADLAVSITAPQTATTGTTASYVATVKNQGPNSALNATASLVLDSSLIVNSITPSQGTCSSGYSPNCNLGDLANGASATITVNATPTTAGTLTANAMATSVSYDPTLTNNQAASSTTVTGSFYAMSPVVTAISPTLVQAGSGTFTLTVSGSGFNSASTINVNGSAQPTAYVSPTQITASVDSTLIKNFGWTPVTVSNPSPGGGTSHLVPLTIYTSVAVPANAMVFDPFGQKIYASVPSASTSITGNSIVAIDPATGSVGTPVVIGSEPKALAETESGNYMYIALSGSNSIAQFDLLQQKLNSTIPVTLTEGGVTSAYAPLALAAMPGTDATLAVDLNDSWGRFGIFDIAGNTGAFRPNLSGNYQGQRPVFPDATRVYASDSRSSSLFDRFTINSNGLTLIDSSYPSGIGGYNTSIRLAGGLVYGAGGGVINPATTPPMQIATLPTIDPTGSGYTSSFIGSPLADPTLQKDFALLSAYNGVYIVRYDGNRYQPETWVAVPTPSNSNNSYQNILHWGQDGLAVLVSTQNYSNNVTTSSVMLLRGPFVAPGLLTAYAAATLGSSSITSINHGAGNTIIALTCSNIAPGVAVRWNGNYRTTTIVDSTHLTVAIPASDLTNAGTATIVAVNPGATASNALTVTIN